MAAYCHALGFRLLGSLFFLAIAGVLPAIAVDTAEAPRADFQTAEQAIAAALREKVSLDFKETPLAAVLTSLAEGKSFSIKLDRGAKEAGVDAQTPISFNMSGISLAAALRHMLGRIDLTYIIQDEVLLIVPPHLANTNLNTRAYPIGRWINSRDVFGEPVEDTDTLVELISTTIAPTTWDEVGGAGAIRPQHDALVVTQTEDVHEQVAGLFALLDRGASTNETASLGFGDESERPIRKALANRVTWQFKATPLSELVSRLRTDYGVPALLDEKALQDANVESDLRITFEIKNVSLGSALRLLLHEYDLLFEISDEALLITSERGCGGVVSPRVYPIGDLVGEELDEQLNDGEAAYDRLIEVITTTIAPTTWDEVGGPGNCHTFTPARLLVISQTRDVHQQIESMLTDLRNVHAQQVAKQPPGAAKKSPRLRTVVRAIPNRFGALAGRSQDMPAAGLVPDDAAGSSANKRSQSEAQVNPVDLKELVAFLKDSTPTEAWKQPDVWIRPVAGRLVIRQTAEIHRKIDELFKALGITYSCF